MATTGGPDTITDGLVFGYDTGYGIAGNTIATRFYPGEPTFNWIDHQNAVAQDSYTAWTGPNSGNWVANHPHAITAVNSLGNSITGYYNGGVGDATNTHHAHWVYDEILKKPVVQMRDLDAQWKAKSFNVGKTPTQMGLGHGGSYTISWLQWSDTVGKGADVGLYQSGFHDGRSYSTTTQTTAYEWERKSFSVSSHHTNYNLGSNVSIYMYGHTTPPNTSGIVKIADVQLEIKPHATPFADDTRSNTASLIDLKRTTDIDVSNVSFDSTGQPEFDGTDDYFTTSGLSGINSGVLTFEKVIRFNGSLDTNDRKVFHWDKTGTTNGVAQVRKGSGNSILMYQHHNGSQWYTLSVDNVVVADTFMHIVVVHDGTTATMYKNGIQVGTATVGILNYTDAAEILLGYRANSEYWKGNIPVFKVYNQALTTAQISDNFNAYKNRFDIQ
jgi:hypothetical protein